MLITTTPTIQGKEIKDYLKIVNGEADRVLPSPAEVGDRSYEAYVKEALNNAWEYAIDEMSKKAATIHANAIVGVQIDYEVVEERLLMVAVSGTAVKV
jgi:uncharacterized protein YbjQ (UPF0145 family)